MRESRQDKSQRLLSRVHDLPVGAGGVKFGKGFDVFGVSGSTPVNKYAAFLGAHRELMGLSRTFIQSVVSTLTRPIRALQIRTA
jgi:hypothetical protein